MRARGVTYYLEPVVSFFRPPPDETPVELDVERWVRVMFGAGTALGTQGVPLVVHVGGRPLATLAQRPGGASHATLAAIRELTQSMALHSKLEVPGDTSIPRPTAATVRAALDVLHNPDARRETLTAAIGAVARRVLSPLEPLLESPHTATRDRLIAWRHRLERSTRSLHLTAATLTQIHDTLATAFNDDMLESLARAEDEAFRPRIVGLAQQIVDTLANTYVRAIERFGANADAVSERIVRRMPERLPLRDLPDRLKIGFTSAMSSYLENETSSDIAGSLATLAGEYDDVLHRSTVLTFPADAHRDVALACWSVVSSFC